MAAYAKNSSQPQKEGGRSYIPEILRTINLVLFNSTSLPEIFTIGQSEEWMSSLFWQSEDSKYHHRVGFTVVAEQESKYHHRVDVEFIAGNHKELTFALKFSSCEFT